METRKVIEDRRSIRSFKSEKVSKPLVMDILDCARLAPSAKNRQPWYFVVVEGTLKNQIADMMIKYTEENDEEEERKLLKCPSSVKATAKVMKEAPILILVLKEKNENWTTGDTLSIGACIENMILRATDLRLGTLWIRDIVYVAEEVAKLVNHSELEINSAISIGYSNQSPKARPRKELKEIVEWI